MVDSDKLKRLISKIREANHRTFAGCIGQLFTELDKTAKNSATYKRLQTERDKWTDWPNGDADDFPDWEMPTDHDDAKSLAYDVYRSCSEQKDQGGGLSFQLFRQTVFDDNILSLNDAFWEYLDSCIDDVISELASRPKSPSESPVVQPDDVILKREGAFFKGQYFDALFRIGELLAQAKVSVDLVDGYINDQVLNVLGAKAAGIPLRILTFSKSINPGFMTFATAFKKQHGSLEIRSSQAFHDRFILIDGVDLYHVGASIKDAGNKGFMFSRIEENFVISGFVAEWTKEWVAAKVEI